MKIIINQVSLYINLDVIILYKLNLKFSFISYFYYLYFQEKITWIEYYTFFWIFIKRVFNQTSQKEKRKIERGNAPGCFWTLLELSAVLPSIVFQYHPNHESSSFILSFPASAASNLKNKKEMFGVVFPNRSFPMDISTFSQIDTFHWVLDMNTFVGKSSSLSVFFLFLPLLLHPRRTLSLPSHTCTNLRRRGLRPSPRALHLPPQLLLSPRR